jgi:hypothetical protein
VEDFSEEELNASLEAPPVERRHLSWGSVVGAAFGLALGVIWHKWGFGAAFVGGILAVLGGLLGRYYVGD